VLRKLQIRLRDFYSTRDTFISEMLRRAENVKAIAEYPALAAVFRRRYAQFRRKLTSLLEKAQTQGTVRRDFPADLLADQMSAMADGWAMMFPVEPARFGRGRIHDLVDMAIAMLAPQSD
jgi:hypothetical protein